MKKLLNLFIAIHFFTTAPICLGAITVAGATFEKTFQVGDASLEARGAGMLTFALFVDVYAGVLYLPPDIAPESALDDVPKRLEVEYKRDIAGEDFGKAATRYIKKNVEPEQFDKLKPKIEAHNSLYVDVAPGDRYALTYAPGKGVELSLNGMPLGTVEGSDFASALFSIWLGENPISLNFKEALLGY